ncbi:MAG TPA: hypothetical protein VFV63_01300, partial [Ilumatobacteraceae bacterium]|nr:hypothetical protein [Ilumatobacteraceae bacterium]
MDLRGIDQRHQPNPQFRAALQRRLVAIAAGTDPGSVTETRDLATIDLESTSAKFAPKRRSSRVAQGILAVAAAAAVVATMAVVISRDDGTTPADTPTPTVAVVTSP